jgi:hypothetical protein
MSSNAVEGYFTKLAKWRLKRGVFHSLADLHKIIAAVRGGHQALESIQVLGLKCHCIVFVRVFVT